MMGSGPGAELDRSWLLWRHAQQCRRGQIRPCRAREAESSNVALLGVRRTASDMDWRAETHRI